MNNNEYIVRMIIINILILVDLIYLFPIFWEKLGN